MTKKIGPKFSFFQNKKEEPSFVSDEFEERKVIIRKVEELAEVPENVLDNQEKYHFHTEIQYGNSVVTPFKENAKRHPNFEDISVVETIVSDTEKIYGEWQTPQIGIAPPKLIKQFAAKQLKDKVETFKDEKELQDNAVNIVRKVVAPLTDEDYNIHVNSLDLLRKDEKKVAEKHHVETPVQLGRTQDIRKHYPSEQSIPEIATKSKKKRMIALDQPHEEEKTTTNLSIIKDVAVLEYAKKHAFANKDKHRTDKPSQNVQPIDLEVGEKTIYTPVGCGAQDYQFIARTLNELQNKLLQKGKKPESVQAILKVAMPKRFFLPSDKTNGDKAVVCWEEETIVPELNARKYKLHEIEQILSVATVIHEEILYHEPNHCGYRNYSGEAANVIELASKLKEFANMKEEQVTQIIRHAKKISDSPSIYAWSQRKQLTYAWHESSGFVWGSKQEKTYSWYEPVYPYGIEYEYMWSVDHDYSFSYLYDYEIHTPQYQKRTVEAKTYEVTHEMYSYRYDKVLYCWEEPFVESLHLVEDEKQQEM